MKILKLRLRNFKGIPSFELDTKGVNVNIYGDNATGKTTIFDAFLWLLFDKDSTNRKDFEIKTLDKDGNLAHGLEHEVEATLLLDDGKQLTLKKSFYEKWTKKRGSAERQFTGHTTGYHIDNVPVKKKEYDAKVAEIADESIFKLLTSPTYFNTQLHWQDRRNILLQVCGDVTDEEVIASDDALAKLPDILQGRKLEDHRKVISSRRTEINNELERIPVRIDEINHNLPDISGIVPSELSNDMAKLKEQLQEKQQELSRIEGGGEVAEKTKQLREIEAQLLEIQHKHRQKTEVGAQEKRAELGKLKDQISDIQYTVKSKKRDKEGNDSAITRLKDKANQLREKWHQVNAQEFSFEQSDTCPTCGQSLPEAQLKEAYDKALAQFNQEKAEKLEAITTDGKATKAEIEALQNKNAGLQKEIQAAEDQLAELQQKANALQAEIETLTESAPDINENPEYLQKLKEKEALEKYIAGLKADRQEAIAGVQEEIDTINQSIAALEEAQAKFKQHEQNQKRIEQLKEQERQLAKEYEKLEQELYLTEHFIRTKVNLLEEKINSRFEFARFKMFEQQINGGIVETCETIYRGVPYGSGLNNAARINVGIDIINTLARYYNFAPPVFIDNREAVTELIETKGQLISLIVSEKDKKLRVEHESAESVDSKKEAV